MILTGGMEIHKCTSESWSGKLLKSVSELDPVMSETLISSHTEADLDQQPCIHMLGQQKLSLYWNLYCSVAK